MLRRSVRLCGQGSALLEGVFSARVTAVDSVLSGVFLQSSNPTGNCGVDVTKYATAGKSSLGSAIDDLVVSGYVKRTLSLLSIPESVAPSVADARNIGICSVDAEGSVNVAIKSDKSASLGATTTALRSPTIPSNSLKSVVLGAEIDGQVRPFLMNIAGQPTTVKLTASDLGLPFTRIECGDCRATPLSALNPKHDGIALFDYALTRCRLETCSLVAGAIEAVARTCFTHATEHYRYDVAKVRTSGVQSRLARLQGLVYAIEALVDVGSSLLEADTTQTSIPEIDLARIFAGEAALEALQTAEEIIGPSAKLLQPHSPGKTEAHALYAPVRDLQRFLPFLQHSDSTLSDLKLNLVSKLGSSALGSGSAQGLKGKLVNVHVNLSLAAKGIEEDVTAFAQSLHKKGKPLDGNNEYLTTLAVDFLSEVFASTAVLYRCSGGLNETIHGLQRLASKVRGEDTLQALTFCERSQFERRRILADMKQSSKPLKDLSERLWTSLEDEYSTHPIMLRASPSKKGSAAKAAAEEKSSGEPQKDEQEGGKK